MPDSILEKLSVREVQTIGECLNAAAFTDSFFPDWEFTTLFGVSRERVKLIASSWPNVDIDDEEVRGVLVNSLNHLLGYPHGQDGEVWDSYITVPWPVVKETLNKLVDDLGL